MTIHTVSTSNCAAALLAFATQAALAAHAPASSFVDAPVGHDFRMIGSNGAHVDRAAFIAAPPDAAAADGLANDDTRVRLFGPVALLHGVTGAGKEAGRLRYTRVFHWDGTRWLLVGVQHTPLRAGVEAAIDRKPPPAHAPWQGADPSGDDELEVLRRLNELYVKAYRDADVAWYDAHLAPDYVVTNGDGSFSDRGSALVAFARPSFATHFRTFPVGNVTIRRFGDVALIEAENAYEMKDSRTGISRYTDIWHKADGRWRCVSAHITVFKHPG